MINPNEIQIDFSYSYRTYAGPLEGLSSPQSCIERSKAQANTLWGVRATFIIEPAIKNNHVPTWSHIILATGPALSEEMHGSQLVIIWFSELTPDTDRVLQAIDWEKYAKDFEV